MIAHQKVSPITNPNGNATSSYGSVASADESITSSSIDIASVPYFAQLPSIFVASAYREIISMPRETSSPYADNVSAHGGMMSADGKTIPKHGSVISVLERMMSPHREVKWKDIYIAFPYGLTTSPHYDVVSLPGVPFKSYDDITSADGKTPKRYFVVIMYIYM